MVVMVGVVVVAAVVGGIGVSGMNAAAGVMGGAVWTAVCVTVKLREAVAFGETGMKKPREGQVK